VGVHHVNNVIKSVGNLCGKTIDHFASVRTINRIGDQRLSISYKQMAELKDEESTTLIDFNVSKHDCDDLLTISFNPSTQFFPV
jgi:hypothetical protein